ncbi:MAG: hypothetical protein AMJ43_10885 [Coxiella sp. DG_40]|nr:MAG: hypothetical protein AMJ43_10885 [Coxiella sp. DG_40]
MPIFNAENAHIWKELSDIDYFTQFIKAWLAFNAWLRNAYPHIIKDRDSIEYIKENSNQVRNKILSLLNNSGNSGQNFRGLIADLHTQLEQTYLETERNGQNCRITFTDMKTFNFASEDSFSHARAEYSLKRLTSGNNKGSIEIKVLKQGAQSVIFEFTQNEYNLEELKAHPPFQRLPVTRKEKIITSYHGIIPFKTISWLADSGEDHIEIGAYKFKNDVNGLVAAIIENIYQMRCLLFHGELVPKKDYNLVYEPAYRIVKVFLEAV